MIYINLKYQGETPLDYQYILSLKKNRRAGGKINLFQGRVPVGRGRAQ
jgi:hypothetical protein